MPIDISNFAKDQDDLGSHIVTTTAGATAAITALSDLKRQAWLPTAGVLGIADETMQRGLTGGTGSVTSGTLRLNGGVVLRAGYKYTHITFFSTAAVVTPTAQWFCLVGQDGTVLATTVDDTTTAWAATSFKTLALSTPYVPAADTPVYLGICVVATTPASLNTVTAGNVGGQTPFVACNSTAGLTTPASLGATATIGANASLGWGAVVGSASPTQDPTRTAALNASAFTTISTPDGSGQIVEPAIEYIPAGWNGHKWWGLITGYTNSNAATENPSIYYSDDGQNFTPVPGAPFPIDPAPSSGHNADPELRLGPDNKLHGVWMRYDFPAAGTCGAYWSNSSDGVTWSTPTLLFSTTQSAEQPTGPVLLYDTVNTRWIMWYVDSHGTGAFTIKRRLCNGTSIGGTWSAGVQCALYGPPSGRCPFEMHIERGSGSEIYAVTTFTDNGTGGANTDLHFGVSTDGGLSWVFNASPLLSASAAGWDNGLIYRADLGVPAAGTNGLYGLWYSAKSAAGVWRLGYTTITTT